MKQKMPSVGIEPTTIWLKPYALPTELEGCIVVAVGFEPTKLTQ